MIITREFQKKSFLIFIVIQIDNKITFLIKLWLIDNFKSHPILFYHLTVPFLLKKHEIVVGMIVVFL